MAVRTYRYRSTSTTFPADELSRLVDPTAALVSQFSQPLLDLQIEETLVEDLDEFMRIHGYTRLGGPDPSTPIDQTYMGELPLTSDQGPGLQPQSHRAAAVDPTVNDDNAAGYRVGSYWINTADDSLWRCVDDTNGAAIWLQLGTSGGSAPGHGSIISWGNDTIGSASAPDRYLSPWYDDQVAPTSPVHVPVPAPGTLRNMTVLLGIPSASDTTLIDFTLQVNGVTPPGSLSVTIPANQAAVAVDNVNSVSVVQGDKITVLVDKAGNLNPQPREIFCTFRWT